MTVIRSYGNLTALTFKGKLSEREKKNVLSNLGTNADYYSWQNPEVKSNKEKDTHFTVFHMSDNHLKYKPLLSISTAVNKLNNKLKNEDTGLLKVHSGDYANGLDNKEESELQIELLNKLGIDISTLGNHEFDMGSKELARVLKDANFTTVVSNMKIPENSSLDKLKQGKNPKIVDSEVIKVNGEKYGVIGLAPLDLKENLWSKSIDLLDGVDVVPNEKLDWDTRVKKTVKLVQKELDALEKQGINKIIGDFHVGKDLATVIAKKTEGLDIVFDGHSHDLDIPCEDKDTIVKSKSGEPVFISHPGQNGKNFVISDISFNKDGIISNITGRIEKTSNFAADLSAKKLIDKKLGYSPDIGYFANSCSADGAKYKEHAYADYIADGVREFTKADIALIPGFGIRDDIDKGPVTARDINGSLSLSENDIIRRNLTGKQIKDTLDQAAASVLASDKKPGIFQVSGLKYTILKNGKTDKDNIKVLDKTGHYIPLDENKTYKTAYEIKLKDGIENFKELMEPEKVDDKIFKDTPIDIVVNSIKNTNKSITLKTDGRITIE